MSIPRIDLVGVEAPGQVLQRGLQEFTAAHQTIEIRIESDGPRGKATNAMIAHVQASMGRNPFWLDMEWVRLVRTIIARSMRPNGWDSSILESIGKMAIAAIKENLQEQRSRGGKSFRELTPKYAAYKQRTYGFVKPILVATGELTNGLKTRVVRRP